MLPAADAFTLENSLSWDIATAIASKTGAAPAGFNKTLSRAGGPYRLNLINAAGFSMFTFSIDGLPLTVVGADACDVEPSDAPSVMLNVAQRASVVLDFSRLSDAVASSPSLWIRVQAMPGAPGVIGERQLSSPGDVTYV